MSVSDMIKKSILESEMYNQAMTVGTLLTMVFNLIIALLMGILIYYIYKRYFQGNVYSRNYAITLIGMTVLTCMVTLAISTNIVISLGMVGALSIIRFRTAIKEPMDLLYMFWAITTGITIGAGMYILAFLGILVMYMLMIFWSHSRMGKRIYLCIIHYIEDETGDEILRKLGKMPYQIKSKILRNNQTELTLQIRCKKENLLFAEKIRDLKNVLDVSLLEFNGEYHG